LPLFDKRAYSDPSDFINPYLGKQKHIEVINRLALFRSRFEDSAFNYYIGREGPELLIVCAGSGSSCVLDAVEFLGLREKVGILSVGTIWPFPENMVKTHLSEVDKVLVVEEVDPFIEIHIKQIIVDAGFLGIKVHGKESGAIPAYGEITPDEVIHALDMLFNCGYKPKISRYPVDLLKSADELIIGRGLTWCAGCPHRASYWALEKAVKVDGRNGYVTGDIGCYCLDIQPNAKHQENLMQAMGSGTGLAAGLGLLGRFGHNQPIISVCGDSTFFHASMPALVDAVSSNSSMLLMVFDNDVTAMTGLQPHPGTPEDLLGPGRVRIDIEKFCASLGCKVEVVDPFDVKKTTRKMRDLMNIDGGVRVLILRRSCELIRMKQEKRSPYQMWIDQETCKGGECDLCSSLFRCPAFDKDSLSGKALIREDICSGCGVCFEICPFNAIRRE
jgi:indolepyruvate ferredoxin oxidoreductase alpha subunit